jgi:hypothetical protein
MGHDWRRWVLAAAMVGLAVVGVQLVGLPPAAAGTCPAPLRDRYEPGDTVTLVGFTEVCRAGHGAGALTRQVTEALAGDGGAVWGYMFRMDNARPGHQGPLPRPEQAPVGVFDVEVTEDEWRGWRMSLTFVLPAELEPGEYYLAMCQDPCTERVGHSHSVYVGVDPPSGHDSIVRNWPLDDPAVRDLPDDALLYGHDGQPLTAAQVRAGIRIGGEPARPPAAAADGASRPSARTETGSGGEGGSREVTGWLLVGSALLVGWLVVTRVGAPRKHVTKVGSGRTRNWGSPVICVGALG